MPHIPVLQVQELEQDVEHKIRDKAALAGAQAELDEMHMRLKKAEKALLDTRVVAVKAQVRRNAHAPPKFAERRERSEAVAYKLRSNH